MKHYIGHSIACICFSNEASLSGLLQGHTVPMINNHLSRLRPRNLYRVQNVVWLKKCSSELRQANDDDGSHRLIKIKPIIN